MRLPFVKQVSALGLSVFLLGVTFGQNNQRYYIDYSIGMSNPLGEFASRDMSNDDAGFATTGISSAFTIGYDWVDKGIGLLFKSHVHVNSFNSESYQRSMSLETGYNWLVQGMNYNTSALLIGAKKFHRISEKSTIDVKALLGWVIASTPEIRYYELNSGYWSVQLPNYSSTVGYQLGLGYQYEWNPKVSLLVNCDFLGAKPEFYETHEYTVTGKIFVRTHSVLMNVVNTRIGIAVNLN
jgi:hypothetical protein